MSDSESIQINPGEAGPTAPDQPVYEGYAADEPQASPQGEAPPAAEAGFEVPDKFMLEDGSVDVASLVQSYQELERTNSQTGQEHATNEMSDVSQEQVLSSESMQRYTNEVQEHGNLTEDSYERFEAAGFPRELVEEYVRGQQAQAEVVRSQTLSQIGGEENYQKLTEWAATKLSDSEIEVYNATMNSRNPEQINMALQGLYARYQQDKGTPSLIMGSTNQSTGSNAFRSWQEVTAAMRDPRYQNDPAYQQDVQAKLNVSNL